MASVGIKSFYRQQKKGGGGVAGKRSGKNSAARSDPMTLVPSSSPNLLQEEELEEEKLRRFDLDMRYGPCIGLTRMGSGHHLCPHNRQFTCCVGTGGAPGATRMERWDRASSMGLSPPADVEAILLHLNGGDRAGTNECLWEGRV